MNILEIFPVVVIIIFLRIKSDGQKEDRNQAHQELEAQKRKLGGL